LVSNKLQVNALYPDDEPSSGIMLAILLRGNRRSVLIRATLMTAAIAIADWRIEGNVPLGFLYLFPMLLLGSILTRWQVALSAFVCTVLTEAFDSFDWFAAAAIPRDILIFAAFFCMGLFVYEVVRSRQTAALHTQSIEREVRARSDAEEQLKVLIESSPAAVFTADAAGSILLANQAAHRLFGVPTGSLPGRSVRDFLPSFSNVLSNISAHDDGRAPFRTSMQCNGRRGDDVFLADVWFSTYRTSAGPRLAAMAVDASEDLRNREEMSLHQLLAGSRILVGAVSHEIRNVCGAIAMTHANLLRAQAISLAGNKDFEALGHLIRALEKIASMNLRQTADQAASVDLRALLEEFRIIIGSSFEDQGITLTFDIDADIKPVWADRQSLLQVFLNLAKNSQRALLEGTRRELTISAHAVSGGKPGAVEVRFRDTGGGVAHPELLFRPFQQQAQATGLGLYLSRAFMRSFRGDLRYEPDPGGSIFVVELSAVETMSTKETYDSHPDPSRGRPQSVPREPQPVAGS